MSERMATVTAKIPVELNERLVATAEKFDRSKTDIIKAALQNYFDSKDEAINAIPAELKERMTFIKLLMEENDVDSRIWLLVRKEVQDFGRCCKIY